MKYENFKYLYPPRPESKGPSTDLYKYDIGEYIAQPKYNGSCCIVFTNGTELHVYNRHRQALTKVNFDIDFKGLSKGKWMVITGEYLNKGKLGESLAKEKDKFIIWDILVNEGEYLIGETLEKRIQLLENLYAGSRTSIGLNTIEIYEHLLTTSLKGIYKAPSYLNGFLDLYNDIITTDLYEGLVLKKLGSKLTYGLQEKNNTDWQIKFRKETKNYNF